jgi:hypothetical protein
MTKRTMERLPITRNIKNWGLIGYLKGCGTHQVPYSLIANCSERPNFSYCQPLSASFWRQFKDEPTMQ